MIWNFLVQYGFLIVCLLAFFAGALGSYYSGKRMEHNMKERRKTYCQCHICSTIRRVG